MKWKAYKLICFHILNESLKNKLEEKSQVISYSTKKLSVYKVLKRKRRTSLIKKLWAFCKSTCHIAANIPHPEHPSCQTSHIPNIPHPEHPTSQTYHIPNIPHPEHPTSHISNIPHLQHPTSRTSHISNITHPQHTISPKFHI